MFIGSPKGTDKKKTMALIKGWKCILKHPSHQVVAGSIKEPDLLRNPLPFLKCLRDVSRPEKGGQIRMEGGGVTATEAQERHRCEKRGK